MKAGIVIRTLWALVFFGSISVNCVVAQTNPLAESKRFIRGTSSDPKYQSFVIPLDSQKGVQLEPLGDNSSKFTDSPWFMRVNKDKVGKYYYDTPSPIYHLNPNSTGGYSYDSAHKVENPLVAFGASAGGTPLYTGQTYNIGIYGGIRSEGYTSAAVDPVNLSQADLYIYIYRKSSFSNGQTNVNPEYEPIYMPMPRKNTPQWNNFISGGYEFENNEMASLGFKLSLRLVENPGDISGTSTWGVGSGYKSPIILKVQTSNPDYVFIFGTVGGLPITNNGSTSWYPTTAVLFKDEQGITRIAPAVNPLFSLDFEARPPWRSTFLHQPHFDGEPMPSSYSGKSTSELLNIGNRVTIQMGAIQPSYSAEGGSPELRSHPILNKLVADLGNDPIAIANYVTNEIGLTDGIAYNDNGNVAEESINSGGVNRGALATYLEGQGSPIEQCALLVHLLRRAGYPAVFVFPPRNELKVLNSRMSQLLRMQFKGMVNDKGVATAPTLIPVNYPWVALSIPDPVPGELDRRKWVHVFPWLKDTEIKEGGNVYDYLPPDYKNGTQWLRKYLSRDNDILSLDSENDSLGNLFPRYVKNQLSLNYPAIAYDSLGIRARDRRNQYRDWADFPQPWSLTENNGTVTIRDNLSAIGNIFDTVSIELWSDRNSNGLWDAGEPRIQTGDMRSLDVHNRKFYLSYQRTTGDNHNLILSLAPYRPDTAGTGRFGSSDTTLLSKQEASVLLTDIDYNIKLKTVHKRQRMLPTDFNPGNTWDSPFGITGRHSMVTGTREVTNVVPISKGDLAAICLNFGRVSPKMLDVHLQEFWAEEKRLKDDPTAIGDNDIFLGTTAYIMGMSYYEKVARNQEELKNLHRSNVISNFAHGLAKLGARRNAADGKLINNGEIDLVYPILDMNFNWLSYAGNRTARPDQGASPILATADFAALAIGDISAQ